MNDIKKLQNLIKSFYKQKKYWHQKFEKLMKEQIEKENYFKKQLGEIVPIINRTNKGLNKMGTMLKKFFADDDAKKFMKEWREKIKSKI